MSSSCLSGGGRAYALNLDLIKPSPSTFTTSNSSSPSSTLSESTNSIFTRKPRTPRKRPNQTYNEAAALLSTAYPKLFPPKNLKPFKLTKSHDNRGPSLSEPPDLLIPFHHRDARGGGKGCPPQLGSSAEARVEKPCLSPGEVTSRAELLEICDEFEEDFDAESMLDEEVGEGIDSIMGNLRVEEENRRDSTPTSSYCYGFPVGMGFDFGCGMRRNELRAMRNVDDGDWWSSTTVNVVDITRGIATIPTEKKKKKTTTTMKTTKTKTNSASGDKKEGSLSTAASSEESFPHPAPGFRLKLNYDDVLNAWSGKGSPFAGEAPAAESAGNDVQTRLAQIELFSENGVARGAIVLRYKEKRRTRLFSKKIRYQVRKANADQRPRIKGRFVRNSGEDD